jgi:hypothetical protein
LRCTLRLHSNLPRPVPAALRYRGHSVIEQAAAMRHRMRERPPSSTELQGAMVLALAPAMWRIRCGDRSSIVVAPAIV